MKPTLLSHIVRIPQLGQRYTYFKFISHLVVYSIIMASTISVNMIIVPNRPWFLLILFGWCGLLIIHANKAMHSDKEK
jgi:hypothetical protein